MGRPVPSWTSSRKSVSLLLCTAVVASVFVAAEPAGAARRKFVPAKPNLGQAVPVVKATPVPIEAVPASSLSVPGDSTPMPTGTYSLSLTQTKVPHPLVTRSGGDSTAKTASVSGTWQPVGDTGISLAAASPESPAVAQEQASPGVVVSPVSKVTATVLDQASVKRLGLQGLVVRLNRADGGSVSAPVAVNVPKSALAKFYGANYASRVRWVQVPDAGQATSALTGGTAVASTVDPASGALVASPMVTSGGMLMTAAASTVSSTGTGSFSATSLTPASSWDVSAQTGGFAWSYPMRVPPAAAGPAPSVALSYDSQSVDGESGSTNNQPSAVGDGWSATGSGFIERSYVPCSIDDGASGAVTTSGDLCWKTDNATVNLSGHSGALVRDSTTGVWKLQSDDNSRIERLTGASNGTYNGEYWRLTTTDGTQYYFGQNQLPGYVAGKPTTNSAWTEPVYGNDTGEPCHAATFAASSCTQAWRWNLDYVVDPHGNAEAFYYSKQTNNYAQNGSTTAATNYVRGGTLDRIEYGLNSSNIYGANAASGKVLYNYASRCVSTVNCDSAHPTNWPDVPWDQNCAAAPCTGQLSPSFWATTMLSNVTTQVLTGGAYANVDVWTLNHSFPNPGDGTSAALWLTQIDHTGYSGGTSLSTPPVTFSGVTMQNRVWVTDGLAPLDKYRINAITTETGAVTSVTYSPQECTPAAAPTIMASPQTNNKRCYPQWWTPQITPPQPSKQDLFHKYVATDVVSTPVTGGGQDLAQETHYVYTGTPAWRYDTSPLTPTKNRTWSGYAGYNTVEIRSGASGPGQTATTYTFFQGMNGDRANATGGTKTVNVTASDGSVVPDSLWLAGRTREVKTLSGVGGSVLSGTITTAWASAVTSNNGTLTARMVNDADIVTTAPLSTGGVRRTETVNTFDSSGRVVTRNAITPDAGTTCTTTTYAASNTSAWMIDYPSRVAKVGVDCSAVATAVYPAAAISDTRMAYDGGAAGAAPTKGDVTSTQVVKSYTGTTASTAVLMAPVVAVYDTMGRVTQTTDQLSRITKTSYTPATGGPLTSTTVTNPLGWQSSTAVNPAWAAPTSVVDQNGNATTGTYDALGRLSKVWLPERPQANNPIPSTAYIYTLSRTAPTVVSTTTQIPNSSITSYKLYDGLGRLRQTQSPSEGGGIVLSDTNYDTAGRTVYQTTPYYATGNPSGNLLVPTLTVPSLTQTQFDSAGRKTANLLIANNAEAWRTTYAYSGADRLDVVPPAGGTPTSTFSNSLGKTTTLVQYLSSSISGTQQATTYSYNARGDMTQMKDPANNTWIWSFDVLGRKTQAVDPDSGTTNTAYDDGGRVTSTEDGRGSVLAYTYDNLDRKTGQFVGGTTGPKQISWVYDTLSKGQPTSSTRYVGSTSTTLGTPYTNAITGYDASYHVTGSTVTIPATAGALAGTYSSTATYGVGGFPLTKTEPAAGGLPAEELNYGYDLLGQPVGLGTDIAADYWGGGIYDHLNRLVQTTQTWGATVYRTFSYDPGTLRLSELLTQVSASQNAVVSDDTFTYDNAGNILSDKSVRDIGPTNASTTTAVTDTQCYSYDALAELTQAWTPASSNCADTPSASNQGGPAPYWKNYSYDTKTGNRVGASAHSNTVNGTTYTTDTLTYPAAGGPHPHAVTNVGHSVGGGTATNTGYSYDGAGNTTARGSAALTYTPDNKLDTYAANNATRSNVYDADGNLLLQTDPSGSTLFLGDTQLHVNPGSTTVSGVRTYSAAGAGLLAERTAISGTSGSQLYFMNPDTQGTNRSMISTGSVVTQRFSDPFGNPRGTASAWPDKHGFLNAPTDVFDGLTHLGARDYDPVIGRFLSTDPVLSPGNPQQNNGYSYGWNNPLIHADPSGLEPGCYSACDSQEYDKWQASGGTDYRNNPPAAPGKAPASKKSSSSNSNNSGILSECTSGHMCIVNGTPMVNVPNIGLQSCIDSNGSFLPYCGLRKDYNNDGYTYSFSEELGDVSQFGSPEDVMKIFQSQTKQIFPFPVDGCGAVATGQTCTLHPGPLLAHGVGDVLVSTTPTSVSFLVTSLDYFDSPGSTITFTISAKSGKLYLNQAADSIATAMPGQAAVAPIMARQTWALQARNLREKMGMNSGQNAQMTLQQLCPVQPGCLSVSGH